LKRTSDFDASRSLAVATIPGRSDHERHLIFPHGAGVRSLAPPGSRRQRCHLGESGEARDAAAQEDTARQLGTRCLLMRASSYERRVRVSIREAPGVTVTWGWQSPVHRSIGTRPATARMRVGSFFFTSRRPEGKAWPSSRPRSDRAHPTGTGTILRPPASRESATSSATEWWVPHPRAGFGCPGRLIDDRL